MAIVSATIARYDGGLVTLTIVYNDANGVVQSATVANNSDVSTSFEVFMLANPNTKILITVPAKTTIPYTNLPSGVRYSATERPEGDPRATNFEYNRVA